MSDTPRCDRHSLDMETEDFDAELAKTYELAWSLERELNAATNQLARICKDGFDNQDTIGLEPADDYILRKLAELRQALSCRTVSCSNCNTLAAENAEIKKLLRKIFNHTDPYADGAPDATAHDKLCNEISSFIRPFIK